MDRRNYDDDDRNHSSNMNPTNFSRDWKAAHRQQRTNNSRAGDNKPPPCTTTLPASSIQNTTNAAGHCSRDRVDHDEQTLSRMSNLYDFDSIPEDYPSDLGWNTRTEEYISSTSPTTRPDSNLFSSYQDGSFNNHDNNNDSNEEEDLIAGRAAATQFFAPPVVDSVNRSGPSPWPTSTDATTIRRPGAEPIPGMGRSTSDSNNNMYSSIVRHDSATSSSSSVAEITTTMTTTGFARADVVNEAELVEALRVEVLHGLGQNAAQAEPVLDVDEPKKPMQRSTWCINCVAIIMIVLVILVGAVVVPILNAVGVFDKASPPPPTPTPTTSSPTAAPLPRLQVIQNVARDEALSSNESIFDPTTPQYQAVAWLETDNGTAAVPNIATNILLERYILAVLYYTTNGTAWTFATKDQSLHFLSEESVCDWHVIVPGVNQTNTSMGVFCNLAQNHTQSVLLNTVNLHGSIPAEVMHFGYLQELDLGGNSLGGTIPVEVESMTALLSLNLGDTGLSGSIPVNITHLTALQNLNLQFNSLSGTIPKELGQMTGLQHLILSGNKLVGTIPSEIGLLTNLIDLNLGSNMLNGTIPTEVGLLTKLKSFVLRMSKLSTCPQISLETTISLEEFLLKSPSW